jgi:hypothetical protein
LTFKSNIDTRAPRAASARAVASPSPEAPPVITAAISEFRITILSLID